MSEITVGELLVRCLKAEGVEMMTGIIDGAHIPIVVHTPQYGIRYINAHHEEAAVHIAEGYARIARKPGVVIGNPACGTGNMLAGVGQRPRRGPPDRRHRDAPRPRLKSRPEPRRRLAGGRHREHGAADHQVRRHGAAVGAAAGDGARRLPRRHDRPAGARLPRHPRRAAARSTIDAGNAAADLPGRALPRDATSAPATRRRSSAPPSCSPAPSGRSSMPARACSGPTPRGARRPRRAPRRRR